MASSGSSQSTTGVIQPPQSGCPTGGVTSKRNEAMRKGKAAPAPRTDRDTAAAPANNEDSRSRRRVMRDGRSFFMAGAFKYGFLGEPQEAS